MTNLEEITVVTLGQQAREAGLGESDNPYTQADPRHELWLCGWAHREMQMRKAGASQ